MTEQNKRLIELMKQIGVVDEKLLQERLKKAYYEGEPIITDQEYDELFPNDYVGYTPEQNGPWNILPHKIAMGSLPKIKTWEDAVKWIGDKPVIWQPKLDGLSIELVYEFGKLTHAILRGGGDAGEDVLKNAKNFQYVSEQINTAMSYVSVRGEVVISQSNFEQLVKESQESYSNRRNCVPGICRRYDGKYSKYLSFWAYDIYEETNWEVRMYSLEQEKLFRLNNYGFKIPFSKPNMIESLYQEYANIRDTAEEFQMDGLVIKRNDLSDQIALKFEPKGEITKVLDYTWDVGSTGKLVPVVHFEKVNVGGTNLTKASVGSYRAYIELCAAPGSIVKVRKMNDVIPKVTEVITQATDTVTYPDRCPICGELVKIIGADIYCVNPKCRIKMENKCTSVYWPVAIKGIKDGWIKKLMEQGLIEEPKDVLEVSYRQLASTGMSETRAQKVIEELRTSWGDIIKNNDVLKVLQMLPIPSIAGKAQEKLANYFETIQGLYVFVKDSHEADKSELIHILGNSKGNAAYSYFVENRDSIVELINSLKELV